MWRVSERSDVVCLIVDARFPLAHCPANFFNFFKATRKPILLLINKSDLVSPLQLTQHEDFFKHYFTHIKLKADVITYSAMTTDRNELLTKVIKQSRALVKKFTPTLITIGFMGQPSVGKSKTMNLLVGHKVTKVRLTAGCTKHLQTYYLEDFEDETNRSVLFCDCPGLVLPVQNAPRPLQILTGVFPTGRVREFYSVIRLLVENSPQSFEQIK